MADLIFLMRLAERRPENKFYFSSCPEDGGGGVIRYNWELSGDTVMDGDRCIVETGEDLSCTGVHDILHI
jgi:hypothetical protein